MAKVEAVGQTCVDCHAEIVQHYATSGMSRSWRRVTSDATATVKPASQVPDSLSGYRYEVAVRSGVLWQIESHPNDPSHRVERLADYQVGSGKHATAWLSAQNGFLHQLPVGWFGPEALWRMNPGYELKNHRFDRPIPAACVGCHATEAIHEQPTANRFTMPIADGIDCSRCHGDATEHVTYWKSSGRSPSEVPQFARLVNLRALTSERVNDVCMQCHLQGDVVVPRGSSSPFDFHPGQRLTDHRHDFLLAGQSDTLGVASHGARMLQSRCYSASGGALTCIHCHDPHRPTSDFRAAHYDAKCASCHQPEACSRPQTATAEPASKGCVSCHMPQRSTREGIHLVFTDHAIRRQQASLSNQSPLVLPPNAHVELVSAWPGIQPEPAAVGAAYAVLHETMGPQQPALTRAHALLAQVVAQDSQDHESRYWLGSALLALHQPLDARREFLQALSEQPLRQEARFRLGLAEESLGNFDSAIAEYKRLLADVPNWPDPYARLAQLYLSKQQAAEAAGVLRKLVALHPDAKSHASLALAERLAGANHEQALTIIAKSLALDSREPAAYVCRGTLWLLQRNVHQARADFKRALEIEPTNAAARQALTGLAETAPRQ